MRGLAEASGGEDGGNSKRAGRGALTRQHSLKKYEWSWASWTFFFWKRLLREGSMVSLAEPSWCAPEVTQIVQHLLTRHLPSQLAPKTDMQGEE